MRKTFDTRLPALVVLFLSLACQDNERHRESQVFQAKQGAEQQAKIEKKNQEQEEWRTLLSRCTSLRKQISSLPSKLRRDMAFFLGEADAALRAAQSSFRNPDLDIMNRNFVRQMLDDTRWFLDHIEKCVVTTKGKQACQLDEDARGMLKETPEKEKSAYLGALSGFCSQ